MSYSFKAIFSGLWLSQSLCTFTHDVHKHRGMCNVASSGFISTRCPILWFSCSLNWCSPTNRCPKKKPWSVLNNPRFAYELNTPPHTASPMQQPWNKTQIAKAQSRLQSILTQRDVALMCQNGLHWVNTAWIKSADLGVAHLTQIDLFNAALQMNAWALD